MLNIFLVLIFPLSAIADSATKTTGFNTVNFNNCDIAVSVVANRDTGPVTRMDGSRLIISIDIYSPDRQQLPRNVAISQALAVFDTESWDMDSSKDISISRYFDGTGYSVKYRQGPIWPVGSTIDINFILLVNELSCQFSQQAVRIMKNP